MKQLTLFESAQQREWYLGARRAEAVGNRVRILWSPKLGLELDQALPSQCAAMRIASRINATKKIRVDLWRREYYPPQHWAAA